MDVAEELGTSPALVHFYFGDRRHLIEEAWREILWAFVDEDSERVAEAAGRRDWDAIAALVRDIVSEERDASRRAHVRAIGEGTVSPDLAATLREAHEATVRNWVDLLRASIERGGAETPLDLEAVCMLVVAVPLGLSALDPEMTPERRDAVAAAYTAMLRSVLDAGYSPHDRAD